MFRYYQHSPYQTQTEIFFMKAPISERVRILVVRLASMIMIYLSTVQQIFQPQSILITIRVG
ncbi:hypothetical protein P40_12250 [Alloalcanivorax xenomutans]|nr:hypothetical protein P40_12250 [Alloalcanivorax xenomutans]